MVLIPDATLHVTQLSEVLLLVRDVARQTQLEAQLVDLIGEFVQIDPTGQWAEWSGQFYNMCASGMLTDLTYKCSSIDGST